MEFRIKHISRSLYLGLVIPVPAFIVSIIAYVYMGFDFTNSCAAMIFIGFFFLCAAIEIVFIILYVIEQICGAKIIIESDHIDVRMLLRRKRFLFDEIDDAKYTHYLVNNEKRKKRFSKETDYSYDTHARSQLNLHLSSGKIFSLNDKATGYEKKREKWITDPELDPDEDVILYHAYKCLCSAYRNYFNSLYDNRL